jgi:hypothetical protein
MHWQTGTLLLVHSAESEGTCILGVIERGLGNISNSPEITSVKMAAVEVSAIQLEICTLLSRGWVSCLREDPLESVLRA